jgi:streptogramin lyase
VGLLGACGQEESPQRSSDTDGGGIVTAGSESAAATEGRTPGEDSAAGSATGSGSTGSDDDSASAGPKFDLPDPDDTGGLPGCTGEGGTQTFSYIWIANTAEGTVSKIDTKTGIELGRYATGPHHPLGSPSRTSVNQYADAVVVNRDPGGIAKVAALESACVDQDGDGLIQTSTGPNDVLPWGEDECVLWYTDVPSPDLASGPRPVAWEGVPVDANDCPTGSPRAWVGWREANGDGIVWRLDGESGAIEDEVVIPNWGSGSQTPYGGAVNAEGDFWLTGKANDSRAVRIDAITLDWEDVHADPASTIYGMAVDKNGDVWGAGSSASAAYHYDRINDTWIVVATPNVGRIRGIQIDRDGFAWGAGNNPCALVKIDTTTDTVVDDQIALPDCSDPVGISIDGDGFVWVVDRVSDRAYKVDPDTHDVVLTVEDLNEPYTYSDMTGNGLNLVINPPG